ncbi:hypothetical protein DYI24_12340 [Rhodopseudomonas sp. BR0C11]|uniref:hypothetical protein n=1 Tax=Rhodopseudomonas sp. BR0C11 TaxID=2269370 RepID=UPI0013E0BBA7|nr:hypothetical protein [Rhodopseudomonas sp. BR0C11]NEV77829.1 hypothetical protein [Rhodopseudomonas sp. BR0C11]
MHLHAVLEIVPMATEKTKAAFDIFRKCHPLKELDPAKVDNEDQTRPMTASDGLRLWQDGPVNGKSKATGSPPMIEPDQDTMLWVVGRTDVVYAPERSEFSAGLKSLVIKHSNLTGGKPAFCGGELLQIDERTVVVNGRSGRYGPKTAGELDNIAGCFRASGYDVWNMGYDEEAGYPRPFVGSEPRWVD